jgi:hypothetical protein
MNSIHKLVCTGLLAFTAFNLLPTVASAQAPAKGTFTLAHDVHWQTAMVPAGEYRFKYEPSGASSVLTLSKLSGAPSGFMFLVRDAEESEISGVNQLVLSSTASGSYVSAMKLPEFGMTLHFKVPEPDMHKQLATTATMAGASASR